MGKQAGPPAALRRAAVSRSKRVVVFGIGPGDAFAAPMRRFLGPGVVFCSELPAPAGATGFDLAVAVEAQDRAGSVLAAAAWAFQSGIACLGVRIGAGEISVGPLALPARAGCLNCVRERMLAASAPFGRGEVPASTSPESAEIVGLLIAREVRAIRRRGPGRSRLVDHISILNTVTLTSSMHRVIPLSRCAVCGGAATFPRASSKPRAVSAADPPERLVKALGGWLDWRTGIVAGLLLASPEDTGVDLPVVATATPPHVVDESGGLRRLPLGWGKGLTISSAILSAVGEAIERYAPSMPDLRRVYWAPMRDLYGEALDPREFALYSETKYGREGFPYSRFDPDVVHQWVLGNWLNSGAPVWVPAVLAFLALKLQPGQLICQGTSNGLAAHVDSDQAALRAILELVERDAFLASWLTASPGRRIELDDSLEPALRAILDGIERLGAKVELYCLDAAACGTAVLCLARGDGYHYPGATVALGCDLEPRMAVQQAILELGQTGPHLRRMMRSGALTVPRDPTEVREMLDHAAWFFPTERSGEFDRIRSNSRPITLQQLTGAPRRKRSLAACAEALDAAGIRVALVDVTSPDVATGPFRVVRAISPDLQPLWYGYGFEREPVPRIRALGVARVLPPVHPIW